MEIKKLYVLEYEGKKYYFDSIYDRNYHYNCHDGYYGKGREEKELRKKIRAKALFLMGGLLNFSQIQDC